MAIEQLGVCTRDGQGVDKDSREAFNLFKNAAEQGRASAKLLMGLCYRAAEGVGRNDIAAMELFREVMESEP